VSGHERRDCDGLRLRVFGTLQILFLKQFGIGLAAAILIDATIIRAVSGPGALTALWGRVAALRLALATPELEAAPGALPGPVAPFHRGCAP
jgi:RND superfamily putative drug exporter